MIILAALIALYIIMLYLQKMHQSTLPPLEPKKQTSSVIVKKYVGRSIDQPIDIIREYDYAKIDDILIEPTRRVARHEIPPIYINRYFDIPTRGYPDNFSQFGILVRQTNDKKDMTNNILRLFGRQIYPSAYVYEYYTMVNSGLNQIKIPLDTRQHELSDGDIIHIKELDTKYKVHLHNFEAPKYYPYII
uniref:Uncharacterized protein n=1 Tax=Mimivirus LCMiAC01 TaxID=2506608 RepID=A0A481Z1H7_9VIRU|nr:MAG: hypothetical protein LCMiAC01_03020 [Mimivirus LCMiAC01]